MFSPIADSGGEPGGVGHVEQRALAEHRDEEPEHAAADREQHAFGEQLPDDAAAPGTECHAQRDLALTDRRARQQERRDVGAGDQQHQRDGRLAA